MRPDAVGLPPSGSALHGAIAIGGSSHGSDPFDGVCRSCFHHLLYPSSQEGSVTAWRRARHGRVRGSAPAQSWVLRRHVHRPRDARGHPHRRRARVAPPIAPVTLLRCRRRRPTVGWRRRPGRGNGQRGGPSFLHPRRGGYVSTGSETPVAATGPSLSAARAIDATKIYGSGATEVRALDGVTVDFARGAFTGIMGPSGSGKSTLMHCVAGLDTLTSGSVVIGDTDVSKLNDRQLTLLRRDKIGFIFQAYNLVPTLSALENITLPMALAKKRPDQAWLDTVIGTVGLGQRLTHRPSELS